MKFFPFTFLVVLLALGCKPVTSKAQQDVTSNNTSMDTLSYSVGLLVAKNLKAQGLESVNAADVVRAMEDIFSGKTPAIDPAAANMMVQNHMQKQAEKAMSANKENGVAFLAEIAKRPEVKTTDSGLQYEVLKEGSGAKPAASDKVRVHYTGTLINGTVFDSSVQRGQPAEFPVGGVIPGWVEALQMMPVGAKWKLYIPSDLAYGERGAGGDIGPNETLIFEVELLDIL